MSHVLIVQDVADPGAHAQREHGADVFDQFLCAQAGESSIVVASDQRPRGQDEILDHDDQEEQGLHYEGGVLGDIVTGLASPLSRFCEYGVLICMR